MRESFGNRKVTPAERKQLISRVFASIAERYDLMNDLMSFGIHRSWKRTLVKSVELPAEAVAVDLAGGTGDVAAAIHQKTGNNVIVADASQQMIEVGRKRHKSALRWVVAEGENLPFADNSVELLTLSYGLRNMTDGEKTLDEIFRCLKPSGTFICLEFSTPVFWLKPFYDFYSWAIIPRLGAFVAREPEAYQYLIESIRKFPNQNQLCQQFVDVGFEGVRYKNLSFGISALHFATKPTKHGA
ncbi:MAG: bifunctional demethylmenaquinone methyltransferase/2-methoxy-6-polyprenyl-1,4-benzoquinol methylase UbiE [Hyphomicrobiales bacterium]|nr:bifunctional demethylmenaquinone methyltransferase/2-methoxy-6-polyprenyl-1,4-benzoquinol methylase UbiE [Hyphomicrobiales bacterium]